MKTLADMDNDYVTVQDYARPRRTPTQTPVYVCVCW